MTNITLHLTRPVEFTLIKSLIDAFIAVEKTQDDITTWREASSIDWDRNFKVMLIQEGIENIKTPTLLKFTYEKRNRSIEFVDAETNEGYLKVWL